MLMIGTCLIDRVLVGDSETMIYWGRIGYDFARHASRALLVYQRFQDVYKYRHSLQSLVQTLQETPWWQHVLIGKMQSDVSLDYIGSSAQAKKTLLHDLLMETAVKSDLQYIVFQIPWHVQWTTIPLQRRMNLRFKEDVKAYTATLEQCARAPKQAI